MSPENFRASFSASQKNAMGRDRQPFIVNTGDRPRAMSPESPTYTTQPQLTTFDLDDPESQPLLRVPHQNRENVRSEADLEFISRDANVSYFLSESFQNIRKLFISPKVIYVTIWMLRAIILVAST